MGRVEEKVTCQFCGKEYSKAGIANHEKACLMNPENFAKEEDVEEVKEDVEVVVEAPVEEVKPTMCKVKLKESIECYIGDTYYRLKANEVYEVPENVKNVLNTADLLQAI